MACDAAPAYYIAKPKSGSKRIVTPNGEVLACEYTEDPHRATVAAAGNPGGVLVDHLLGDFLLFGLNSGLVLFGLEMKTREDYEQMVLDTRPDLELAIEAVAGDAITTALALLERLAFISAV